MGRPAAAKRWRRSQFAAIAAFAAGGLVLFLLEKRRPLRAKTQPEPERMVRNLMLGAASMAVVATFERPLVEPLASRTTRRRRGLVQQLPLSPGARDLLAILAMDYTIYLWHVATHRVPFSGVFISSIILTWISIRQPRCASILPRWRSRYPIEQRRYARSARHKGRFAGGSDYFSSRCSSTTATFGSRSGSREASHGSSPRRACTGSITPQSRTRRTRTGRAGSASGTGFMGLFGEMSRSHGFGSECPPIAEARRSASGAP